MIQKGGIIEYNLNTDSTIAEDLLNGRVSGLSNFKTRNHSVSITANQLLKKGTSELALEIAGHTGMDFNVPVYKVRTKYPPPPYLPGEVERRAAMALADDCDSELARLDAKNKYDNELFHYY